jgi:predicted negative regulator of RcsB-dependent stress response
MLTKLDLFRKMGRGDRAEAMIDDMMKIEGLDQIDLQKLIVKKVFLMFGNQRKAEALQLLDQKIGEMAPHQYLMLAKGEMLVAEGQHQPAIEAFDKVIADFDGDLELLATSTGAKADALFDQGKADDATQVLDQFADQDQMPPDLRGEALLHKALILRLTDRRRGAILAENKAVDLVESPADRAQMQRLVDQLRRRFEQ